jgi:putative membrane protein
MYWKALHIIFIITWFAGMFYMPRLFIYNTEAENRSEEVKKVLHEQFAVMMRRLWYGITIPSAILTLIIGPVLMFMEGWNRILFEEPARWLLIKLIFVILLYLYFYSLHRIFLQQLRGEFRYTSQQLRIWNEMATVLLVAITMLAVVKQGVSFIWGLAGLALLMIILVAAIKGYQAVRSKKRR